MIKSLGILTSGGDAPGMNNAVRAIVKTSLKKNIKPYLIYDGFRGLMEGKIEEATSKSVSKITDRGGTILGSARLPEFKDPEMKKEAVKKFKKLGIDALVVIGGDGSYLGAAGLTELGLPCIGLPGTIDNDIAATDWTIGFDTALTTIVESIDKLKSTADSHQRAMIVEVMGRNCGDLALYAGIAVGVEIISTPENKISEKEIIKQIIEAREKDFKRDIIILVTENIYDVNKLAKKAEKETGIVTRSLVLSNLQRGGTPSARDRILASKMGVYAVEEMIKGKQGVAVCEVDGKLISKDIIEAVKETRPNRDDLINIIKLIK